jgi:hypothetical protein
MSERMFASAPLTVYANIAHSVARPEVASSVGDDFSTGRMIRGLDTYDLGYQRPVLLLRELEELVVRRSGPDNENRVDAVEALGDLVKEALRIVWVLPRLPATFRMTVNMVLW